MTSPGIPILPWHHAKKGSAQIAARIATSSPVEVSALQVGDRFETLLTSRLGKVVSCCPSLKELEALVEDGAETEDVFGVRVKLYTPGDGWEEKVLAVTCLVKWRE